MIYYKYINTENSSLRAGDYVFLGKNGKFGLWCIEDGIDYMIEACSAHKFQQKENYTKYKKEFSDPCNNNPIFDCNFDIEVDGADGEDCEEFIDEISLTKMATSSGPFNVGDVVTYAFIVTNNTLNQVTNISIDDPSATVHGGPISLEPDESDSTTFSANYVLTQADIDSGNVNNTASVTGIDAFSGESYSTVTSIDTVIEEAQEDPVNCIKLEKSCTSEGPFKTGDVVNFTFTIENCGNNAINNVSISDPFVDGITENVIPSLLPNQLDNTSFTAFYVIKDTDTDGDKVNIATVSGTSAANNQFISDNSSHTFTVKQDAAINPCIDIQKSCTPEGPYQIGDIVTYDYLVTNCGDVVLENVNVVDDKISVSGGPIFLAPNENSAKTFIATHTITQQDVINGSIVNTATAQGNVLNDTSIVVTDSDSHTAQTSITASPCINLNKVAASQGPYNINDIVQYTYTITNCGNVDLTNISLTDDLISINNTIPALAASQSTSITASYTITNQDVENGNVTNNATVNANYNGTQISDIDDETVQTAIVPIPCISLNKMASSQGPYKINEIVQYTYTITNCGNVDLSNIMLTDDLISINTNIPTLIASQSTSITASYTITNQDVENGSVTNNATVNANYNGNQISDTDNETVQTEVTPNACISLNKMASSQGPYKVDEIVQYTYTITNCGNVDLTNISLTDDLISINNTIPTLPASQSTSITASYTITNQDVENGSVTNNATVNANYNGTQISDTDNETVQTVITADTCLNIIKNASAQGPFRLNDVVQYTYTVTNCGNVDLTNVVVSDNLINIQNNIISMLPAGQNNTLTASYTITEQDVINGSVTNTATVSSQYNNIQIIATDDETVQTEITPNPCITLSKVASSQGPYKINEIVQYTYTITNCGNVDLSNISIIDNLIDLSGNVIPTLLPNQNSSITETYTITQQDVDNGSVTNTATVSGDYNGSTVTSTDNETVQTEETISLNACIDITKSCTPDGPYNVGDTITYLYTVTNCGTDALQNVIVTDDKVSVSGGPISLGPNENSANVFSATHIVNDQDEVSGSIINTATANGTGITTSTIVIDTATHTAIISDNCSGEPISDNCSVSAQQFTFENKPSRNDISTDSISCGAFGKICTFDNSNLSPLSDVLANDKIINVPIPAHEDGCLLMLQVFGGEVSYTGIPLLIGSTGTALTPTEISNLNIGNSNPNIGSGSNNNGDIFQQIICLEGNGLAQGTVDIRFPNLSDANPADFIMYSWTKVCSTTCPMKKEYVKQTPIAQGTNGASFANTCSALAFVAGRNVGGFEEVEMPDPNNPDVTCIEKNCIDPTCLNFKDIDCIENDWTIGSGTQVSSYISAEEAIDNGGIAVIQYINNGVQQINYNQNPNISNNAGYVDDVIYTVIEFDLCENQNNDIFYTEFCNLTIQDDGTRCSYPLNYTCVADFNVSHSIGNNSSVTITPEINGTLDTSQSIILDNNSTNMVNITLNNQGIINMNGQTSCNVRYCLEANGCSGTINFPEWTSTLSA